MLNLFDKKPDIFIVNAKTIKNKVICMCVCVCTVFFNKINLKGFYDESKTYCLIISLLISAINNK